MGPVGPMDPMGLMGPWAHGPMGKYIPSAPVLAPTRVQNTDLFVFFSVWAGKAAPRRPKTPPRPPKKPTRCSQKALKTAPKRPKTPPRPAQDPEDALKTPQDAAKAPLRRRLDAQDGPRGGQESP